jgi:hypothetical protein
MGDGTPATTAGTPDGDVPWHWVDPHGDTTTLELLFRVGLHDERLPATGLTELALRLAFEDLDLDGDVLLGATVTGPVSICQLAGPARAVADTATQLCRRLADLPVAHLDRVRDEQATAAAAQPEDPERVLLAVRYGALGPGLHLWRSVGLAGVDAAAVHAWAATRFTRASLVVRGAGPRPARLELPLRPGRWYPPPAPPPERVVTPCSWPEADVVAAGGIVPLGPALGAAIELVQTALTERCQRDHGWRIDAYPQVWPLTAELAHLTLATTADPARAVPVVRTLLDLLSPTAIERTELPPRYLPSVVATTDPWGAAMQDVLHGPGSVAGAVLRPATPEDLRECLRALAATLLALVPDVEEDDLPALRVHVQPAPRPLEDGDLFRAHGHGRRSTALQVGRDGVALLVGDQPTDTKRFAELVGMLAWSDGSRQLIDEDGSSLLLRPWELELGFAAMQRIDRAVAPQLVVPMDATPRRPLADPPLVRRAPALPADRATERTTAERRAAGRRRR